MKPIFFLIQKKLKWYLYILGFAGKIYWPWYKEMMLNYFKKHLNLSISKNIEYYIELKSYFVYFINSFLFEEKWKINVFSFKKYWVEGF